MLWVLSGIKIKTKNFTNLKQVRVWPKICLKVKAFDQSWQPGSKNAGGPLKSTHLRLRAVGKLDPLSTRKYTKSKSNRPKEWSVDMDVDHFSSKCTEPPCLHKIDPSWSPPLSHLQSPTFDTKNAFFRKIPAHALFLDMGLG